MALQLIKIIDQKVTYLVEVQNEKGETKNEWLDEETIKFIALKFASPVTETPEQDDLKCKECGRKFKRRDHLKEHMRKLHTANKESYSCPVCQSEFGYKSNWTQHMKRTHKWSAANAKKAFKNVCSASTCSPVATNNCI